MKFFVKACQASVLQLVQSIAQLEGSPPRCLLLSCRNICHAALMPCLQNKDSRPWTTRVCCNILSVQSVECSVCGLAASASPSRSSKYTTPETWSQSGLQKAAVGWQNILDLSRAQAAAAKQLIATTSLHDCQVRNPEPQQSPMLPRHCPEKSK